MTHHHVEPRAEPRAAQHSASEDISGNARDDDERLLDAFARLRVLVLGDPILDTYLTAGQLKLCREAPVPNVSIEDIAQAPGGAANTAANAAALGAQVQLAGLLGDDAPALRLRELLTACGVDTRACETDPAYVTRHKQRVLAERQLLLSFSTGGAGATAAAQRRLVAALDREAFDVVIAADYGYGSFSDASIAALAPRLRRRRGTLVVDSRRRLKAFARALPDAVKPSFEEVCSLLNHSPASGHLRRGWIAANASAILRSTGAALATVTLDAEGSLLIARDASPQHLPGRAVARPAVAGAGDTYTAALALALGAGATPLAAARLAQRAASRVIDKDGTAVCHAAELRRRRSPGKQVADLAALGALAQQYRREGRRIIFTNGCFDLLHAGHVALLNQAKTLGDVLIVAVNGDASIRKLKGAGRPINRLADRLQVLSALACVDHLIAFDAPTAHALVQAVRPAVFVKGGTYQPDAVPEGELVRALGGEVHRVPLLWDHSTRGLIHRIAREQGAAA